MIIRQTPYIDYNDRNRVFLDLEEGERWSRARLSMGDWSEKIEIGAVYGEARVPLVESEACLFVELWDDNKNYARTMAALKPVKKWKAGFMLSSHEDLGYQDYVTRLAAGSCAHMELALDYMDAFPDYHYFIEHMDCLRTVMAYRGDALAERIKARFHNGQLDVCTPHSGVHTHWHGAEQLARSTVYARECAEQFDIEPKTALFADLSGVSWAAVGAYAQAGVRYLVNTHNRFRDHKFGYPIPPLFWWQAPNGRDRLLFWSGDHYQDIHFSVDTILFAWSELRMGFSGGQISYAPEDAADLSFTDEGALSPRDKLAECQKRLAEADLHALEVSISDYMNSLAGYPWDVLPVSFYMDHQIPSLLPKAFCDRMAAEWKWPKFTMRTPTDCMRELEARFGDNLPTFTGDLSNQWSDAMTASPVGVARKRRAARWLPAAETLNAALGRCDGATRSAIDDALNRMCTFDDHCWATEIKHPTDMHRSNHQYVKEQNARVAEKTVRDTLGSLVSRDDGTVSVFWPHSEDARVPVRIPEAIARGRTLTGCAGQRLYDGSVLTSAIDFAAFSARSFALTPLTDSPDCFARVEEGRIITDRYDLRFDAKSGRITSLVDLRSDRELIDTDSEDALGDFLFIETVDKQRPDHVTNRAAALCVEVLRGPLAVTLLQKEFEPESRAKITTAVTLYRDMPQIDIESRFEDATGALLGTHSDRYRKNIFYAFPLNVPDFRFLTEMPLGWIDERTERLPLRAQDFVIAKDAVRVETDDGAHGILLTSRDMPVFHLGDNEKDALSVNRQDPVQALLVVCGNCDHTPTQPEVREVTLEGVKVYATHGHRQRVKYDLDPILNTGHFAGADVVLFGHSHKALCQQIAGMWLINPGTSGLGERPTYALLEFENGEVKSAEIKEIPKE